MQAAYPVQQMPQPGVGYYPQQPTVVLQRISLRNVISEWPCGYNSTQQPTVVVQHAGMALGPQSSRGVCPSCHASISSRVVVESSSKTHVIALLLCLFGCIPCCLIPYCVDSCQNINHHCPSCGTFLGTYQS